jgi:hypothetical protein
MREACTLSVACCTPRGMVRDGIGKRRRARRRRRTSGRRCRFGPAADSEDGVPHSIPNQCCSHTARHCRPLLAERAQLRICRDVRTNAFAQAHSGCARARARDVLSVRSVLVCLWVACVCVRLSVRACVRACVRAYMRGSMRAHAHVPKSALLPFDRNSVPRCAHARVRAAQLRRIGMVYVVLHAARCML